MNWLEQSIMHTRGVARGQVRETHELSESRQGTFHYTIGPYSTPVMNIAPGDRVVVQTRDAFDGKILTEQDLPSQKLRVPFLNPQSGPIMIEGAEKGDVVAVYIESMLPRGDNPRGTCCLIPRFGALTGTEYTATLNEPLPEITRKIDVDEDGVYWSKRVTLPYKPHIGTLSLSPEIDSINSLTPDNHGGNMDVPDMGPGSITYLPVRSAGARLFIGDAHACHVDDGDHHHDAQGPDQCGGVVDVLDAEPAGHERHHAPGDRRYRDGVGDDDPPSGLPAEPRMTHEAVLALGEDAGVDVVNAARERIGGDQFADRQAYREDLEEAADHP